METHKHKHILEMAPTVCSFPHLLILFISSCYLIISVLTHLLGQSARLPLSGPQVSMSTPFDPQSLTVVPSDTHNPSSPRPSLAHRQTCMCVCVWLCFYMRVPTISVRPCVCVWGNAFWKHGQSSTANLTRLMRHKQASSGWAWVRVNSGLWKHTNTHSAVAHRCLIPLCCSHDCK